MATFAQSSSSQHTPYTFPCSAPRLPAAPAQLFAAPAARNLAELSHEALGSNSFFDGRGLRLSAGGRPWWDCKDVPLEKHEQSSSLDVVHIECTPYGSATSVNSLGLEAVAMPDWTRTRAPSLVSSDEGDEEDEEMLLPGAFDQSRPVDRSMTPTYSALGLQFDEDLEQSDELSPFAGFSSPLLQPTPLAAPPPSPVALILEQLSLQPRKRRAATALPTPPRSQGDESEPSGWGVPILPLTLGTPFKSLRRPSIPLPSLPTTPISAPSTLPPTLTRFTSALQCAIERPISSRVELSPPPPSPPTLPAALPMSHAVEQEESRMNSLGLGFSSPRSTPAFIPIPTPSVKRRRRV